MFAIEQSEMNLCSVHWETSTTKDFPTSGNKTLPRTKKEESSYAGVFLLGRSAKQILLFKMNLNNGDLGRI